MKLVRAIALLVLCSGCARVYVERHVAVTGYTRQPQRLLMAVAFDTTFQDHLYEDFTGVVVPFLASCGISAEVYRADEMALNAARTIDGAIQRFRPDATLTIRQLIRTVANYETLEGVYLVTMSDVNEKREVWRASIRASASSRAGANLTHIGANFGYAVLRTLAADGILRSCPPVPARTP